jgi:hypothetical protein
MKLKNLFLIFLAIFLEYLRDYCFININLYIEFLNNLNIGLNVFNYTDSLFLYITKSFEAKTLTQIKWAMSLFFAITFYLLGALFSHWNFSKKKHKKFIKIHSIGGAIILSFSLLIYIFGKFLNLETQINFYFVSLELSHFIQSLLYPISFLTLFSSFNIKKT